MSLTDLTADDLRELDGALFTLDWMLSQLRRGDLVEALPPDAQMWAPELVEEVIKKTRALRQRFGVSEPNVDEMVAEIDSDIAEAIFKVARDQKRWA